MGTTEMVVRLDVGSGYVQIKIKKYGSSVKKFCFVEYKVRNICVNFVFSLSV
jgi:hypothetical protein